MSALGAQLTDCLHQLIPAQAKSSNRRFPLIDAEDFEQEMWLRAVASADRFNELLKRTDAYDLIGNELRRACTRLGQSDNRDRRARKAKAAGYTTWDEFFYDRRLAGHLLSELIEAEWDLPAAMDRATKGLDLTGVRVQDGDSDGHDSFMGYLALLTDCKAAYEALSAGQRHILRTWFTEGSDDEASKWDHEAIASTMGLTYDALRKRKDRALNALLSKLGGESPWVRKARQETEASGR